jgi:hypothetical protein
MALGVAAALWLVGPHPLNPSNVDWIVGDAATYYSGWEEFRHDTHLSLPLSWTTRIGYPVGTSLALLDAIPLAAVVLRPLSAVLPIPFQYLGAWMLLSFVLQAYFASRLCRRLFPDDPSFALAATALFLVAAPLVFRLSVHIALCSQWLILGTLDAYFTDPGARPGRWLRRPWILLALSATINPYLAAMCLVIVLGCVARLAIERRAAWPYVVLYLATTCAIVIASGALIGALVSRDAGAYWASGYGRFSLNLNAAINPGRYSALFPTLPLAFDQGEDYVYLGSGILALLAIGIVRRPRAALWLTETRLVPLIGVALVCTALALSTTVTLGRQTLFTIPVPAAVYAALQGLRASGRLFWPAYYLIVLAALSLTFWTVPRRYRTGVLIAALVIQIIDLHPLFELARARAHVRVTGPLTSPVWSELRGRYDNLILLPAYQCDPFHPAGGHDTHIYFGRVAAGDGLRLNSYYAARYVHAELEAHCVDLLRSQLDGQLDPRSAYVVSDGVRTVWEVHGVRSHQCALVDGVNLCTAKFQDAATSPPTAAPYVLGTMLDFTNRDGDAGRYLAFGWGDIRSSGTWSHGPLAMIRLGFDTARYRSSGVVLEVSAEPFVIQQHPTLDVDVVVNGQRVAQWRYPAASEPLRRNIPISGGILDGYAGLDVEFRIRNPESPLYVGAGFVPDFLGVNLQSVIVRPN